ncbi:NHL repeat-containing protein [Aestuariibaculum suncheonense]|uniref:6-bladed beta-propeller n=1 Tax=Aestuariibaculum suncheonense TaxID=1028745 RepID=A0A8J6UBK9_9FLAO|nr:6-bladed beta-propeller [Aestuariibaculum suncheonense]MBD0835562.1 6-bladed beta-propeller [Aestuariibaculum suncheonense]
MSRRSFLKQSSLVSLGILTSPLYSSAFSFNRSKDVIVGHNSHRYKVDMNWGNLNPSVTPVKDCHEMIQDSKGRILLLTNHTKNNVIIYDKSGKFISSWGTEFPGGHGLTLVKENGEDFLLITDYERHQIVKTTVDGKKVFEIDFPSETGKYNNKEEFKPTETTVLPNGDFYVADGYGNQYIMHYNHKGELQNVFGGKGKENGQFLNAHGICYDGRDKNNPSLLISARSMNILKRFDLSGSYIESIPVPGALICRPVIHDKDIYFAVLKSKNAPNNDSGFLLIMNENNEVVSCPGATAPSYNNGNLDELYQTVRLFQHPHDVCIDDDENMYVAQWNSGNTYPVKLTRI